MPYGFDMKRVVVLHGLGRTALSMQRMVNHLMDGGLEATSINYPSTFGGIYELTGLIEPLMPNTGVVNFVGHSLGGILAKHLARSLPKDRRGRIVQLGSPNRGSEAASQLSFMSPILGHVLKDLEPNSDFNDNDLDVGAIAGTRPIGPMALFVDASTRHDGLVTVESAWGSAPPEKRFLVDTSHTLLPLHSGAISATLHFLENGRFT